MHTNIFRSIIDDLDLRKYAPKVQVNFKATIFKFCKCRPINIPQLTENILNFNLFTNTVPIMRLFRY